MKNNELKTHNVADNLMITILITLIVVCTSLFVSTFDNLEKYSNEEEHTQFKFIINDIIDIINTQADIQNQTIDVVEKVINELERQNYLIEENTNAINENTEMVKYLAKYHTPVFIAVE